MVRFADLANAVPATPGGYNPLHEICSRAIDREMRLMVMAGRGDDEILKLLSADGIETRVPTERIAHLQRVHLPANHRLRDGIDWLSLREKK